MERPRAGGRFLRAGQTHRARAFARPTGERCEPLVGRIEPDHAPLLAQAVVDVDALLGVDDVLEDAEEEEVKASSATGSTENKVS